MKPKLLILGLDGVSWQILNRVYRSGDKLDEFFTKMFRNFSDDMLVIARKT